jgi:hypothetical protein
MLVLWSALALAGPPKPPVVAPKVAGSLELELHVEFTAASGAHPRAGDVRLGPALDALVAARGLAFRPLLAVPEAALADLSDRAARRTGVVHDLERFAIVDVPGATPAELADAGNALLALDGVEAAWIAVRGVPPPADLDPTTPDLGSRQGYAGPDPGIDAEYAHAHGLHGEGIRLSDCEYDWELTHEDLDDIVVELEAGQTPDPQSAELGFDQHGTAVLGELAAPDNGYGVTGLATGATVALFSEWTRQGGYRREDAIAAAAAASDPGDVVLLEMQMVWSTNDDYGPAELDPAVWELTRTAVDAGVIVVGAAGNGGLDLDSSTYRSYTQRGDSGAILVGAGSANARHEGLYWGTHGARVDVQGWGEGVFTTGYGGFATYGADPNQAYEDAFNGTSSASPIAASAAVLVSQALSLATGEPATPEEVRELLVETGTPEGSGVPIGPLPDVRAALAEIGVRYGPFASSAPIVVDEGTPTTLALDVWWRSDAGGTVAWDWGDGDTSEGESVEHAFPDDGRPTVRAELRDATGRTVTVDVPVQVLNVAPIIDGVDIPNRGHRVKFVAHATDPGDDTVSYRWAFDDGTVETGRVVHHRWDEFGPASVRLTVTDEDGGVSWEDVPLVVEEGCGCGTGPRGSGALAALAALLLVRRPRTAGTRRDRLPAEAP